MLAQEDFAYSGAEGAGDGGLAVSVFVGDALLREEMVEDIEAAGLEPRVFGNLPDLLDDTLRVLGDVVLVDCPVADAREIAGLSRLDERAARAGAHVVVSTTIEALDAVFGACDLSKAQILVSPTRGERVIALGRVLARGPRLRLRELSEGDRLTLLRLTEQVAQISERLEKMGSQGLTGNGSAFRFESPAAGFRGHASEGDELVRKARPAMPDARLVRQVLRQRQLRGQFFEAELFADPAWDMLLDLAAARVERKRVSVTSLCIASGVPPTTALRWIGQMTAAGLFERIEDETDRRRVFIDLSDRAAESMARYFAAVSEDALVLA